MFGSFELSPRQQKTLGIVVIPTAGHITPVIGLANEAKGDDPNLIVVIVLTSWDGYKMQPKDQQALLKACDRLVILESKTITNRRDIFGRASELLPSVINALRGCDYILYDFMAPEGYIAAKHLGLAPFCIEPSFVGKLDDHSKEYQEEMKSCQRHLVEVRDKYGVDLTGRLRLTDGVVSVVAEKYILLSYKNLIYAGEFSQNPDEIKKQSYFMRPTRLKEPALGSALSFVKTTDKKIIYFSLGTIASGPVWDILDKNSFRDFVRFIYRSLIQLAEKRNDFILIISSGRNPEDILGKDYTLPDNVHIFESLPQRELLCYASVFFTHAGNNSLNEGIDAEVGMVFLPLMFDQHQAAAAAARLDLGVAFLHSPEESKGEESVVKFTSDQYYRTPFRPGKIDEAMRTFEKTIDHILKKNYAANFVAVKNGMRYTFKDLGRLLEEKVVVENKKQPIQTGPFFSRGFSRSCSDPIGLNPKNYRPGLK